MNAKETKIQKARNLRYRRPIVKELNIAKIREDLWEIQAACDDVRWNDEFEDESDSLLNALNGDEDEAYEFKMAFAKKCKLILEEMNGFLNALTSSLLRRKRAIHMAACLDGIVMKETTMELTSRNPLLKMKQKRS